MVEDVIVGIAERIITNLAPEALQKVGKLWCIKHELEALRDAVSMLRAVLDDAKERSDQNPPIQIWLEELQYTFYHAQDVLEEFNIAATRQELNGHNEMFKEVRTFFSNSNQLVFKLKMSHKVRTVRKRIEAINSGRRFHLNERPVNSRIEREWRKREETRTLPYGDIVGRGGDEKAVLEFLLDSNFKENVSILPIVGIAGLGKTALARWIYNDEMVSKLFHLKVWVRVSNDLDLKKIMKTIVVCVKKKEQTTVAMGRLESEFRAIIDGRRCLLVLDDLRENDLEKLLSLKTLLVGGGRGSKILITTRLFSVAKITSTVSPYLLSKLSESASLDLLMQMDGQAEEAVQDSDMLAFGKEIVIKCSGIPLIIRTIGSLLFLKKTKLVWPHFNDNGLREVSLDEDNIKSVLVLCYNDLPWHLKQCFAFCSLFPKDYEIKKQTLVNLWVAEGFIQPTNGYSHLEDIAHGYFMDLLFRNFFQDYEKDTETCKINDFMHDLACAAARTEYWVEWDCPKPIYEKARHISHGLTSKSMGGLPISHLTASSVRTFLYAPTYREMEQRELTSEADIHQLIQTFKRLRILDLHATIIKKVPMSICKLKNLTYLDLSHNSALKRLPNSITRLQNLQTLNLQGCFSLEELPRDLRKLISLRNLDIDYCYSLNYLPCGLGQLTCLHRLTRFILPRGKALAKKYCKLEELIGLNNISGSLSIENLEHSRDSSEYSLPGKLIDKDRLKSLILKWSNLGNALCGDTDEALLDSLRPHSDLRKLTIHGYQGESFPGWIKDSFVSSLPKLVEVRLVRCGRCKLVPQLGQLPHLKSLEIWRLPELEYLEPGHSSTSMASFPSLLRLDIRYCKELKAMPLAPPLEHLILREVNQELISHIFGLTKLKSLDISQIELLECLPQKCLQSLISLERLGISECPQLASLSLGMLHLSNLVHLSFSNCEELNLSIDESGNFLDMQGLVSLRSMDILGVPKLAYLPQWLLQVSNLEHLSIKKCLKLKALPEQIEALQSLERLEIVRCPLLTSLPEGMRKLAFLSCLKIADSPYLEEVCKRDVGEDWNKIAHIPYITHKLESYERDL